MLLFSDVLLRPVFPNELYVVKMAGAQWEKLKKENYKNF